jgi:threonine dehydrogenase-like Zn-dependent dehydrogenase
MGLLTGLILKAAGCQVAFVEPVESRRRQAAELCCACALTPQQLARRDRGDGFDAAIDCSGRVEAVSQAIGTLRKSGRLVLLGLVEQGEGGLPLAEVTIKELSIEGSWLNPNTFEEAVDLATDHQDVLRAFTTEVFKLDDIAAAFERASSQDVNRVLVAP